MIADRDYMKEDGSGGGFPNRGTSPGSWSCTVWLIVVLIGCFAAQNVVLAYGSPRFLREVSLSWHGIAAGKIWQLLTFQFLHGGGWHLLFNLLGLWFFGRSVEHWFGARKFLFLYFFGGVVGGLMQVFAGALFPEAHGAPVVGASAGVLGLLAVYCRIQPDARILVAMVLPVPANYFLYGTIAISLFFAVVPVDRGTAHVAHLGGILTGLLFLHMRWHLDYVDLPGAGWWSALKSRFKPAAKSGIVRVGTSEPLKNVRIPKSHPVVNQMESEVDTILDKIAEKGIHSLTEKERRTLESAREWLAKRGR